MEHVEGGDAKHYGKKAHDGNKHSRTQGIQLNEMSVECKSCLCSAAVTRCGSQECACVCACVRACVCAGLVGQYHGTVA